MSVFIQPNSRMEVCMSVSVCNAERHYHVLSASQIENSFVVHFSHQVHIWGMQHFVCKNRHRYKQSLEAQLWPIVCGLLQYYTDRFSGERKQLSVQGTRYKVKVQGKVVLYILTCNVQGKSDAFPHA